jgi:hypothetical protein
MTIVNDDSRVITKLETSLTEDTRVVIYDRHIFIVQATACVMSPNMDKSSIQNLFVQYCCCDTVLLLCTVLVLLPLGDMTRRHNTQHNDT